MSTTSGLKIRPMLAAQEWDERWVKAHLEMNGYLLMQPKIDGMRVLIHEGQARSRSWKLWTNRYLQAWAADGADLLQGWDTEVIPGHIYDSKVFRLAQSGLRAEDGSREFTAYLFDNFDPSFRSVRYCDRLEACKRDLVEHGELVEGDNYHVKIVLCPTWEVRSLDEIYSHEAELLSQGWEGAILRRHDAPYKYNRATPREGWLSKLKRYQDTEIVVTGFEPRMRNENEAKTSELGYTTRSAHKAGLVEEDTLGVILGHLVADPSKSVRVGTFRGWDFTDRKQVWDHRDQHMGRILKVKIQGADGGYDNQRTPVGLGFRDPVEL